MPSSKYEKVQPGVGYLASGKKIKISGSATTTPKRKIPATAELKPMPKRNGLESVGMPVKKKRFRQVLPKKLNQAKPIAGRMPGLGK